MTLEYSSYHCKQDFTRQYSCRAKMIIFYEIAGNKTGYFFTYLWFIKDIFRLHLILYREDCNVFAKLL